MAAKLVRFWKPREIRRRSGKFYLLLICFLISWTASPSFHHQVRTLPGPAYCLRGVGLDDFGLEQTSKSATDAANNNAYVQGISDKDWVDDTLMRLRSKDLDNAQ
jgi:hypothetical protein